MAKNLQPKKPDKDQIIQIAGIRDIAEAEMLLQCGVDWLGFPLRLAFHKQDISETEAARIVRSLKPLDCCVLITYLSRAKEIDDCCSMLGVNKVQLHGKVSMEELEALRAFSPGLFVLKSLIVRQNNIEELNQQVADLAPLVDAFITDTFDPLTGACGATGKTHDWAISRDLVEVSTRPVILAGGLRPDNVAAAIRNVRPAGVDVHTGVEHINGRKSEKLVRTFVNRAREAFAVLGKIGS
ncbi:MAG: phosphoribosylanthranilate isomerase [Syntrophobacteraceae bacterium]